MLVANNYGCGRSPALDHEVVDGPGAARGRGLDAALPRQTDGVTVGDAREGLAADGPDLKQHHCKAVHIACHRVALV